MCVRCYTTKWNGFTSSFLFKGGCVSLIRIASFILNSVKSLPLAMILVFQFLWHRNLCWRTAELGSEWCSLILMCRGLSVEPI